MALSTDWIEWLESKTVGQNLEAWTQVQWEREPCPLLTAQIQLDDVAVSDPLAEMEYLLRTHY
jgi:hypothetical protein